MSKMDNLRAMREARYEESQARARASSGSAAPKPKAPPASAPLLAVVPDAPAEVAEPREALCGHRAISGRTCTREAGHAAKSHRYA
jgi:hypothetical protein